jgi:DNA-binding transcriptional MocR family regulator
MHQSAPLKHLIEELQGLSSREISARVIELIRSGAIPVGSPLPPVRELAEALGVSPASISAAWGDLREAKVISGRGRSGVWVSDNRTTPRPRRFEGVGNFGSFILADLTYASPDPALLPPLETALCHGAHSPNLHSYHREPITAALREIVAPLWPYPAAGFMATNGGFEALHLVTHALLSHGNTVAIETPTTARLVDILENAGLHLIAVQCDAEGPRPDSLRQALSHKPAAFFYEPRTNGVTGHGVSPNRLAQLASLLENTNTLIVEDDGLGDIAARPAISLGSLIPERTVHIRTYSKSLGPDLRLAVLSAPATWIDQIQAYRNFGASWTSRVMQDAAAWMLRDAATMEMVAKAREVYAQRRRTLIAALAQWQIHLPDLDGLCLWVPVPSEQYALVTLAAHGFAVFPGSRFTLDRSSHIRIGTGLLTQHYDKLAEAIALCMDLS